MRKIIQNFKAETPKPDAKKRNIYLIIGAIGLGGRIALAFTPAAPLALASLATEIMWAGLGGLGMGAYYQSKTIK